MEDTEKQRTASRRTADIRKQLELASTDTASGRDGNAISATEKFSLKHSTPTGYDYHQFNSDSKYVEVNNLFCSNVGYSREDLIGVRFRSSISSLIRQKRKE